MVKAHTSIGSGMVMAVVIVADTVGAAVPFRNK